MAVPVVIDTSALLAILLGEPERAQFLQLLSGSETRLLSAANALETAIVVESRRRSSRPRAGLVPAQDENRDCGGGRGASFHCTLCVAKIRERPSSRGTEFWRLLCVRPNENVQRAAACQGPGFPADRFASVVTGQITPPG